MLFLSKARRGQRIFELLRRLFARSHAVLWRTGETTALILQKRNIISAQLPRYSAYPEPLRLHQVGWMQMREKIHCTTAPWLLAGNTSAGIISASTAPMTSIERLSVV